MGGMVPSVQQVKGSKRILFINLSIQPENFLRVNHFIYILIAIVWLPGILTTNTSEQKCVSIVIFLI